MTMPAAFAGRYLSREQPIQSGSYGAISLAGLVLPAQWSLSIRVQPRTLDGRPQAVLAWPGALALYVTGAGAELHVGGQICRVAAPMLERRWYELRLIASDGILRLTQIPLQVDWGTDGHGIASVAAKIARPGRDAAHRRAGAA